MEQPARPREPDTVSMPASGLPLQRSAENRVIGGVCGGLAEYTDIDPIVYRVLATVLTLVGGAGLILYGAAMLLVPDARTGTAPLGRLFSGGRLRAAGVALAVICLLVVLGGLTGVFGGASLSIVVIAVLAVLVAHKRGVNFRDVVRGHPADQPPPADAPPPTDATPSADQPTVAAAAARPQAPPRTQQPVPPPPHPPPADAPTMRMPVPPPQQPPPQPPPQGYVDLATLPPPGRPARREKLPSITGWVWLLAALAGSGIAWLQHMGEVPGDIRVPLAVALGFLGIGLVVSTWIGRASVKAWGVLLTLALGAATVAIGPMQDIRWQPVTWTPASAAQLADQQPYRVGVGAGTLDLTEVPLQQRQTYRAEVTMTAGRLVVLVPRSAAVDLSVQCEQCAGDALGHNLDGTQVSVEERVEPGAGGEVLTPDGPAKPPAPAPVIDLDIVVQAGQVEVRRAA